MKLIVTLLISVFLFGCAGSTPLTEAQRQGMVAPLCKGDQCTRMWQSAQVWVIKNSQYKVQLANDAVIQTYNATNSSTYLAFTVTKELNTDGSYSILMQAACDNFLGCAPETAVQAIIRFNSDMKKIM